MFMDDDDLKTLNKTILDVKTNNGGTNKGYGGHNEKHPAMHHPLESLVIS
jgi:hypothetical protein